MRLLSPSEEIAAAFGSKRRIFLNSGIRKKPSWQNILRHVSPFRRGGCQSSAALWVGWTQPQCLRPSNQTRAQFLPSWGIPPLPLGSFSSPSPVLKCPGGSAIIALSSQGSFQKVCPLPTSCIDPFHQQLGPSLQSNGPDPQLITVCSRWQRLELGVGLWHPPGILLPSHCPPTG